MLAIPVARPVRAGAERALPRGGGLRPRRRPADVGAAFGVPRSPDFERKLAGYHQQGNVELLAKLDDILVQAVASRQSAARPDAGVFYAARGLTAQRVCGAQAGCRSDARTLTHSTVPAVEDSSHKKRVPGRSRRSTHGAVRNQAPAGRRALVTARHRASPRSVRGDRAIDDANSSPVFRVAPDRCHANVLETGGDSRST